VPVPDSRGVAGPFRVSWCRSSSAFLAPSAPASPVRDRASRFSSCDLTPSLRPELLSWGFALLQSRSVVRLPLLRRARPFVFANGRRPASPGFASLGFLLPRTLRRRVPLVAPPRSFDRSRSGGGRQTPTGAVLRVLAPLDGYGHARGTHELLRIRRHRGAPTLRGLVSCRSRPWSRPSELSLLEEPYPLSRASCFLAGSRSTNPTARHDPRCSRPLSPARRPLAAARPKARWTGRPGRRFPGVARTLRVTGCPVRIAAPSSRNGRAHRIRRPARPLRSLAPLESPFHFASAPLARGRSPGRCSPGLWLHGSRRVSPPVRSLRVAPQGPPAGLPADGGPRVAP